MRILLIVPPYRTADPLFAQLYPMPLGPVWVGTVLQAAGHDVTLKDFLAVGPKVLKKKCVRPDSLVKAGGPPYLHYGVDMEDALEWVARHVRLYDAVGLAAGQCNLWETAHLIAEVVKAQGVPLVGGGPFVSTATEQAMKLFKLDVAVQGEAEGVAEEAFGRAANGETGLIINGTKNALKMDALPLPNWGLAPPTNYPTYGGMTRGVLTISRGCPWQCQFCSVHTIMTRRHRRQNKGRIQAELTNLHAYGVKYFCFLDDNLLVSEAAADTLLKAVADFEWDTKIKGHRYYIEEGIEVRVAAKPGLLKKFVGKWDNLALGLETANAARAEQAKKPYTREQLESALQECKTLGVPAKAFYIIGLPGDTLESVCKDLIEFASFGMTARPNNLKIYPGTAIADLYSAKGWVDLSTYDWRLSTFWTPDTDTLTYRQIKRLKTLLRTLGVISGDFRLNPFTCSFQEAVATFRHHKYTLSRTPADPPARPTDEMRMTGNFFRATPYRMVLEIFVARFLGATGADTFLNGSEIIAYPLPEPKDELQAALFAAMGLMKSPPSEKGPAQMKLF